MSEELSSETLAVNSKTTDGKRIYPIWFQDLLIGSWGEGFVDKRPNGTFVFVKRRRKYLLVTFDNLSNVRDKAPVREPWACKFARDADICHLGVMVNVPNWFREKWIIEKFQALVAEGFFEGYERVLFAGTSMGAYASLAFGELVPHAHIAAFNPQTTLDTKIVPWETRFEAGRRQDWTLPLADPAQNTENQKKIHLFFDPNFELDAKHADRLQGDNITKYHCRISGHKSALFLNRMGRLPDLMDHMMFGDLTQHQFYQYYKSRKKLFWYRNAVREYFETAGRTFYVDLLNKAFMASRRKMMAQNIQVQEDLVEIPAD